MRRQRCSSVITGLLLGLLAGRSAWPSGDASRLLAETVEPEPPPAELVIGLLDERGRSPLRLDPEDLVVWQDGAEARVLALEPMAGEGLRAWLGGSLEPPLAVPWRLVVYVDPVLATERSVRRAAAALARRAGTLSALGSVEVVVAAPEPAVRLGATRDPKLVAAALAELARERFPAGELWSHRDRFLRTLRDPVPGGGDRPDPAAVRAFVLASARTEQEAIHGRLGQVLEWLTAPSAAERHAPKAVLWVVDGFDASPIDLYSGALADRTERARLGEDLAAYGGEAQVAAFAEDLARAGWTAVAISPGLRPFGLAGGEDLFSDPRAPLRTVVAGTGGELVPGADAHPAMVLLAQRWRLRIQPPRQGAGARHRPRRLEVEIRRPGLTAVAPRVLPAGGAPGGSRLSAASPLARGAGRFDLRALDPADPGAVFLLPLAEPMATGRTLIAAQAVRPEVAAVSFQVGDGEARTDREPPFEVTVDLPMIPRAAVVRAVAFDADGVELGRDEAEINGFEGELRLAIREPRRIPGPGTYDVTLEVRTPRGAGVATVDLFWGERHLATLRHPPYRSSVAVPPDARGGFLLARARLPDGEMSEAAVAMGQEGFGDRVEVDLVQLPTVVRDRRGHPVVGLERDDFRVREEGRAQSLRAFGSAADTPLAVGLAVDVSTSVEGDLPLIKSAAIRFLRKVLRPEDRGQLVAFAGRPWLVAPLGRDLERLVEAIEALPMDASTALHDAVMLSLFHLRGVSGRKAVVLLTDGRDTVSRHSSLQSLELARRCGIPVYVLALGSSDPRSRATRLHRLELANLATTTGGRLYLMRSLDQLAPAYDEIAEELRSQYQLSYASDQEAPATAGWRRVEVDVIRPGLTARTVAGYFKEP